MEKKQKEYKFLVDTTIRGLVKQLNEEKISKEDIVFSLYNNQYILVYTK